MATYLISAQQNFLNGTAYSNRIIKSVKPFTAKQIRAIEFNMTQDRLAEGCKGTVILAVSLLGDED